jgi:cytochrome c oxidase cbb3-type subunit IV
MDAGLYGSVVTVLFFILFIGIVWWAYHRDNKKKYEEAGVPDPIVRRTQ